MRKKLSALLGNPYLCALFSSLALYWLVHTEDTKIHVAVGVITYIGFFMLYSSAFFPKDARKKDAKAIGAVLALMLITAEGWPDRLAEMLSKKTALLFCFACFCLYRLLSDFLVCLYTMWQSRQKPAAIGRDRKSCRAVFWTSFALIWIAYFLFFLNQYPGSFDCDTPDQMGQIMGEWHFNNANPLLSTLCVGFWVKLGMLFTGNINGGIACYTLFQLSFAAGIFAYTVSVIWRKGLSMRAVVLSHLFFNLMPYNIAFGIGMWKDTFFALLFLWVMVRVWVLMDRTATKRDLAGLFALALAASLARNSGWSALLLFGVGLCLFARKRKDLKGLALTVAGGAAAALVVIAVVYPLFRISNSNSRVMSVSVPLQQVSRVVAVGGDVSEEELELIAEALPPETIRERYQENLSDPIKFIVNEKVIQQKRWEFCKLWIRLGLRNPHIYYDAYVGLMKGYWDLQYRSWLWDGSIFENSYGIQRSPILFPERDLDQLLKKVAYHYGSQWKSYVFFRAPFVLWSSLVCLGYTLFQGKKQNALFYIPILAVFAGLMLTSPGPLFRYTYCTAVCLPLIYCLPYWQREGSERS